MYRINEFLTPAERLEAIRLGAMKKLAEYRMTPSDFSRAIEKRAKDAGDSSVSFMGALKLALMLGIPVGALTYAMKSAFKPAMNQNAKLKAQLSEYNNVIDRYKQELGAADDEDEKKKGLFG